MIYFCNRKTRAVAAPYSILAFLPYTFYTEGVISDISILCDKVKNDFLSKTIIDHFATDQYF